MNNIESLKDVLKESVSYIEEQQRLRSLQKKDNAELILWGELKPLLVPLSLILINGLCQKKLMDFCLNIAYFFCFDDRKAMIYSTYQSTLSLGVRILSINGEEFPDIIDN